MLNFAFAPALWLGLALLPVLVFYFLRLRFRRQPTGSTFLWRRLVRPESGGLRLNWKSLLLLILQVIGLLGLIFAAARPVLERSRVEIPGVVFLLDESASMASHEAPDGKTRFRLAADRIVREINNLAPATPVAVFLCAGTALPLETEAGKPRIRTAAEASAIAGLLAGREAGWDAFREEAVSEALRVWESGRSTPWQAVLVTDGGCDLAGSRLAAVFDGRLLVLPMGAPVANLGIAAAWVDGADPSILRYTLRNSSAAPWPASLVLSRDAQSLHRLALTVAPGQTEQSLQLDGPLAPGGYRLELAAANGTALAGDGFGPDDGICPDRSRPTCSASRPCLLARRLPGMAG